MKHPSAIRPPVRAALVLALAATFAAAPVLACGEATFNVGKGLEYQGYLAPRPATVLIYGTPDPAATDKDREQLLAGLRGAGHTVRVVADADAYMQALREGSVDLVIADADAVDALVSASGSATAPRLLPVVAKGNRAAGGTFELFLKSGARLGQYLRAIDRAVAAAK
jgi:hypothetical protein